MKIVVDISVIGLAQLFETARTGIYRAISSLSQELLSVEEIDLWYSSLSSIQVNELTDHYFNQRELGEKAFPKTFIEKALITTEKKGLISGSDKIANKILSRLYRMSHTSRIGKKADIFHSMYSALPKFQSSSKPLRMMTIYDIIPLIHPEYFTEGFVEEFRPIVESFSPEKDYIFTISQCTKNDICSYFKMDPERVFVTHLAAKNELYFPETDKEVIESVKNKFNIPEGRYFLTLATVEKRKNLEKSIKSFRKLLNEPGCSDINFVLVGTRGWKVQELIDEISSDSVLQEKVIFTGFVPDEYLSAIYSGAEGFLYPSLYEGFGLPPLEAMQCGLPVITSNTSSLPEVVGDAGILIDPNDEDQIAGAMLSLMNNSTLRTMYIEKGLKRAAEFSWKSCSEKTLAGYRNAWECR